MRKKNRLWLLNLAEADEGYGDYTEPEETKLVIMLERPIT